MPRARSLFTVPSSDRAFEGFTRKVVAADGVETPEALERRLRRLFPRAVVRARDLSGDDHVWYIYREGHWVDGRAQDWWADPSLPRLEVSTDGWVTSANAAAGKHLGVPSAHLLQRHFTDFAIPGTLEDAILAQEVLVESGESGGTIRHLRGDGTVQVSEYHARATEGGSVIVLRPTAAGSSPLPARPHIATACVPEADHAFARVAAVLVARMPEPTPDGLRLRLAPAYPEVAVTALAADRWRVVRDPREPGPPIAWDDPALPRALALDGGGIVDANDALRSLLGVDPVGRHWQDFAPPRSVDESVEMRAVMVAEGQILSTFRLRAASGAIIDYDYRASWEGDRFLTVLRPYRIQGPAGAADTPGRT